MTTEREKIIALAHQHFSLYVRIEMEDEQILAFYHAAQAEAFEAAAKLCEEKEIEGYANRVPKYADGYAISAAIREMAKGIKT